MIERIVADDTNVYWIERGDGFMYSLRKMQRDGSAETILADNYQFGGYGLALDATHVYFGAIRSMRLSLMRVSKDATVVGTESVVCTHGPRMNGIESLSIVGDNAYWIGNPGYSISLFSARTSMPSMTCGEIILTSGGNVTTVAADDTHAFVGFTGLGMDWLERIPHGSSMGTTIVSGVVPQVVRDGNDLFWALTVHRTGHYEVHRASPDGTGDTLVHRSNDPVVVFIVHPSGVFTVVSRGAGASSTLCRYPR